MIDFGDYVEIEQKRYGATNEMYMYKVINGGGRSNAYRSVPVDANKPDLEYGEMADVIYAICCGVMETEVEKFRVQDVRFLKSARDRENKEFNPS